MKSHSYKKRRKASVIAFSPSFNRAVKRIRSEIGIPTEGFTTTEEMNRWYRRHHAESTKEPSRHIPPYYWHFPKQFVELMESWESSPNSFEPSRSNYYPEVPLDRCAMDLVKKFDLPEEVVSGVKVYILGVKGSLGVMSSLPFILVPVDEGEEGTKYMLLVAGIDEATTQKDWVDVWKDFERALRMWQVGQAPSKRPLDKVFLRDLSLWKQIKTGKTAKEVANEWTDKHPGDETIGEDTVRKAVSRIDKIMRPDS